MMMHYYRVNRKDGYLRETLYARHSPVWVFTNSMNVRVVIIRWITETAIEFNP